MKDGRVGRRGEVVYTFDLFSHAGGLLACFCVVHHTYKTAAPL